MERTPRPKITATTILFGLLIGIGLLIIFKTVLAWTNPTQAPPGGSGAGISRELTYNEFTSVKLISSINEGAATTIVTASAYTFDGVTPVIIEFYAPWFGIYSTASGTYCSLGLYDGSSPIGKIAFNRFTVAAGGNANHPVFLTRKLTPSAGSHTYSVRGWGLVASECYVGAGAGGNGAEAPGYVRITKAQ